MKMNKTKQGQSALLNLGSVVIILGVALFGVYTMISPGHDLTGMSFGVFADLGNDTTVQRFFDSQSLPGSTVTVRLQIDIINDTFYLIDEVVPAGMTVTSASDGGNYTAVAGHIYWSVLDNATDYNYTYELDVGSTEGVFTFNGTYGSEHVNETSIMGTNTIVVAIELNTTVERFFNTSSIETDSGVSVRLQIDIVNDTFYSIDETIPGGMSVTSASNGGNFTSNPGHIYWYVLAGANSTNVSYIINSGATPGNFTFSGIYGTDSLNETNVTGELNLEVIPAPTTTTTTITTTSTTTTSTTTTSTTTTTLRPLSNYTQPTFTQVGNCSEINHSNCIEITDCFTAADVVPTYYLVVNNITTDKSCIFITRDNAILDLNGYTIVYGNTIVSGIPNSGFEDGTGATPDNWNLTGAPNASRVQTSEMPMIGGWTLKILGESFNNVINSEWANISDGNRTYKAYVMIKSAWNSTINLNVESETDGVLCNVTHSGASLERSDLLTCAFKPNSTSRLRIKIIGYYISGHEPYDTFIDLADIRPAFDMGIGLLGYERDDLIPDYYGQGVSGRPNNVTIKNGRLVQGQGEGISSSAIYKYSNWYSPGTEIYNIYSETYGEENTNFMCGNFGETCDNNQIHDNVFVNHERKIIARETLGNFPVVFSNSENGTFYNNQIYGGQGGAYFGGANNIEIYNNTIRINTTVTNHYSIQLGGSYNISIHDNYIEPFSGDGISMGTWDTGPQAYDIKVYNNYVNVTAHPCNPEYYTGYSSNAIRISDYHYNKTHDNDIFNNSFIVYAKWYPEYPLCTPNARGMFLSSDGLNNIYSNNTILAYITSENTTATAIYGAEKNGQIINNYVLSDYLIADIGNAYAQAANLLFKNNEFVKGSDPFGNYLGFRIGYWIYNSTDHIFLNNTFSNGANLDDIIFYASSGNMNYTVKWYLDIYVLDENSSSTDANITITDNQNNLILDSSMNGLSHLELTEYYIYASNPSNAVRINYTPYRVNVTRNGELQYTNIILNRSQSHLFMFYPTDYNTTNLSIWNSKGSSITRVNDSITYYANYTTSDAHVDSANCTITFYDGSWPMVEGANIYTYTRTIADAGNHGYTVRCDKLYHYIQSSIGSIEIVDFEVGVWYVNNQEVDCDDNGPATFDYPFCTIGEANTRHSAGDTVYISPGEYREALLPKSGNSNSDRTVYSGLGTREQVKVVGSDNLSGGWIKCSGADPNCAGISDNIYYKNWTSTAKRIVFYRQEIVDPPCYDFYRDSSYWRCAENNSGVPTDIPTKYDTDCWEDRAEWYIRADLDDTQNPRLSALQDVKNLTSAGMFYYKHNLTNPGSSLLYVWPFNTDNANTHLIECSQRRVAGWSQFDYQNYSNIEYLTIQNLTIMHSLVNGINLHARAHDITIQDSELGFNSGQGTAGENPSAILKNSATPLLSGLHIIRNKIHDQGSDKGPGKLYSNWHSGLAVTLYSVNNTLIQDNEFYNLAEGIYVKHGGGDAVVSYENVSIINNTVHDISYHAISFGSGDTENTYSGKIVGNSIYNVYDRSFEGGAIDTRDNNNNMLIVHNTIFNVTPRGIGLEVGSGGGVNFTVKNNIIHNVFTFTSDVHYLGYYRDTINYVDSNYNLFNNSYGYFGINSSGNVWYSRTTYNSIDDWQFSTGLDLNSTVANPLFISESSKDFILQNTSPAIDSGIFINGYHCALADDNGGENLTGCRHWYGSAPDIGAYEYIGPTTTSTTITTVSSTTTITTTSTTTTSTTTTTLPNATIAPSFSSFNISDDYIAEGEILNVSSYILNGTNSLDKWWFKYNGTNSGMKNASIGYNQLLWNTTGIWGNMTVVGYVNDTNDYYNSSPITWVYINATGGTSTTTATTTTQATTTPGTVSPSGSPSGGYIPGTATGVKRKTKYWHNKKTDESLEWVIKSFTVVKITTTFKEDITTKKITINEYEEFDEVPDEVKMVKEPYRYLKISKDDFQTSFVNIEFRVLNEWLNNREIVLMRHDGGWRELPTRLIDKDDEYSYFLSTTPGFSYFAIKAYERQVTTTTIALTSTTTQSRLVTTSTYFESDITDENLDLSTEVTIKSDNEFVGKSNLLIIGLSTLAIFIILVLVIIEYFQFYHPDEKVEEYIISQLKRGISVDRIRHKLISVGWKRRKVDVDIKGVKRIINHKQEKQLEEYIEKGIESGENKEIIESKLTGAGWNKRRVDKDYIIAWFKELFKK